LKVSNQRSTKPWRLLEKKPIFKSKWLTVNREKVSLPNGKIIKDFYTLSGEKLVCILAVTSDQKIVLIKQYRQGAKKVLWDIPGGGVGKNESFLKAAKRELAEETDYKARKWISLGQFYPDPARSPTIKEIFLALGAIPLQKPQRIENIFVKLTTFQQIKRMIGKNQIRELGARLAIALVSQSLNLEDNITKKKGCYSSLGHPDQLLNSF